MVDCAVDAPRRRRSPSRPSPTTLETMTPGTFAAGRDNRTTAVAGVALGIDLQKGDPAVVLHQPTLAAGGSCRRGNSGAFTGSLDAILERCDGH